jgi:hypothetical protein
MPMPKRSSVDDFFAQLNDVQRPHLETLRKLSLAADPKAREELKWNLPVYVRDDNANLWMLQNFKMGMTSAIGKCGRCARHEWRWAFMPSSGNRWPPVAELAG